MDWINYHHLYYFWTVAREGSITKASATLRLAQPTISAQLRQLEEQFSEPLLTRRGRGMVLTATGHTVFRYAEEIFALGAEMQDAVRGRNVGRMTRFNVGISDTLPKLIAHRLLAPAITALAPVHLVCDEDNAAVLLANLAKHELDLVLTDAPIPGELRVKAFSHLLGTCGVSFLGTKDLAEQFRDNFPKSLHGAPVLMPFRESSIRRELEHWFEAQGVTPKLVGEFKDSALMKTFGQAGSGIFPAPTTIAAEVCLHFGVEQIGATTDIVERFFAISSERKIRHPAVRLICEEGKNSLFPPEEMQ